MRKYWQSPSRALVNFKFARPSRCGSLEGRRSPPFDVKLHHHIYTFILSHSKPFVDPGPGLQHPGVPSLLATSAMGEAVEAVDLSIAESTYRRHCIPLDTCT